jgi:VanZ family protein/glutaredoxin
LKSFLRAAGLWAPVVAYGAGVYYLSSLSVQPVATRLPDYVAHPLEYLGLTFLVVRALNGGFLSPISSLTQFTAITLTVIYAISDEIHQLHVPRRTASLKDVLSDTLGAVLAVGVAEVFQRFRGWRRGESLTVTLVGGANCHLCHDAREILNRLSREVSLVLVEVDVASDAVLKSRYGDQIPVILAGEKKISKGNPDEAAIRRRLLSLVSRSR